MNFAIVLIFNSDIVIIFFKIIIIIIWLGGSEKNKVTDREILRNILCRVEKLLRKVNNNLFEEIFEIYGEVNQLIK